MPRIVNSSFGGGAVTISNSGAGNAGNDRLSSMEDVGLTAPATGDVLVFSGTDWNNDALSNVEPASSDSLQVLVSSLDTTPKELADCFVAGANIALSVTDSILGKQLNITYQAGGGSSVDYTYGTFTSPNASATDVDFGTITAPTSVDSIDLGTII